MSWKNIPASLTYGKAKIPPRSFVPAAGSKKVLKIKKAAEEVTFKIYVLKWNLGSKTWWKFKKWSMIEDCTMVYAEEIYVLSARETLFLPITCERRQVYIIKKPLTRKRITLEATIITRVG